MAATYELTSKRPQDDTYPANTLILDFQSPELSEINFCCLSHPGYGILYVSPKREAMRERVCVLCVCVCVCVCLSLAWRGATQV